MCDYSLHNVKSRPAKVGDKLITRDFGTGTRGFATSGDTSVAVCVRPGTELALAGEVTCLSIGLLSWRPDRAPDMSERRSASYGSSTAGRSKDCR